MPLKNRVIRVTLNFPSKTVVLTQNLGMRIRIKKAALAIQNRAEIEVYGLRQSLRQELLSQFTAWRKRLNDQGSVDLDWISVQIEAGYTDGQNEQSSVIFLGNVVNCDPSSGPPDVGVRLVCFTRQIDKTLFTTKAAPAQSTYYDYVQWAAEQMGFGSNFVCDTSFNDLVIQNPARSRYTVNSLLIDIQNIRRPNVAAFVDDGRLIVKDRSKIINPSDIPTVDSFIDAPGWNEWGVDFQTLFRTDIRLAGGVALKSKINPGINNQYVIMVLEYVIASREVPFYLKASGAPPAS